MNPESTVPRFEDRRAAPRFSIRLPLKIKNGSNHITAMTRDVSSRGIYFYVEPEHGHIAAAESIEFTLHFPPEITMSTEMEVECKGKILRTHAPSAHGIGVVAIINSYAFLGTGHA